jgi:aspartyl-tRNA(Asn)/glutamyl-tRNA(Gln) amidotransferase subunit B
MRTKEDAQDYRYFPDPDLLPLIVTDEMIESIRRQMPKTREAQRREFMEQFAFSDAQAQFLTSSRATAAYALSTFAKAPREAWPQLVNWISGPLSAKLNREKLSFAESKVAPEDLSELYGFVASGEISSSTATGTVLAAMWEGEGSPGQIIRQRDLRQISDAAALEKIIGDVVANNAKQVADYRAGKQKAFNSLVGQVMKATQGKANPAQVNEILRRKLGG